MKLKSMFTCLLAATAVFSSCSKDDQNGEPSAQTSSVLITVAPGESNLPGTRGEAGKVANNDPISLGEGHIFFAATNGTIVRHVEIVDGIPGTDQVSLTNLTSGAGATISEVPTSAAKCYIFSKVPSTVTLPSILDNVTNISAIKDLAMNVNDLYDPVDNGVSEVPLWGEGNVVSTTNPMTVNVDLYAMGSRIQIEKLTGYNDIENYRLEGIFINNFYQKMTVGYEAPEAIVNHSSNTAVYVDGSTQYAAYPSLFDYRTSGLASMAGTVATPVDGGEVWAYNIWPTEGMTGANAETMPHLILVMKDIVYDNGSVSVPVAGPLYLTVKGMRSGGTLIEKIEKGNSYTFSDIRFEFSDLDLVPEINSIDATVTITQHPWKDTSVDPEL